MARITVEDCLTKVANRFALICLASKRAKQIFSQNAAKSAASENERGNKPVVMALREIASGRVRFKTDEEIRIDEENAATERARIAELKAKAQASMIPVVANDPFAQSASAAPVVANDPFAPSPAESNGHTTNDVQS